MPSSIEVRVQGDVHDIQVVKRGRIRQMRFGARGGWQGALDLDRPDRPVFPYQRAFLALVHSFPALTRFVSLGIGTGTALRTVARAHPDCELFGVELDSSVIDVAIGYFDCPSHKQANYWVGDAVHFVSLVDAAFDLVFLDVYLSNQIYSPCLTPEFVDRLAEIVGADGAVACNLITAWPAEGDIARFLAAAAARFEEVTLLPVGIPYTDQNTLAVFSKTPGRRAAFARQIRERGELYSYERIGWPLRMRDYARA